MKLSIKILLISWGGAFIAINSHAQDIKPIIDFAIVDPDNPLVAFDTAAIIVHVKTLSCNTDVDTGNYYGNLKYYYQSDKMGTANPTWKVEVDNDPNIEWMPPGGKLDTIQFFVDTLQFRTMETNPVNVILIWPSFINPLIPQCDSGEHVLWHVPGYYYGLNDQDPQQFGSTVFPNPAMPMQIVFINSKYSQDISRISIMNTMGQVLNSKEFMDGEDSKGYVLPTEELRSGIYHIHLFYKDKKTEVVKFIKN